MSRRRLIGVGVVFAVLVVALAATTIHHNRNLRPAKASMTYEQEIEQLRVKYQSAMHQIDELNLTGRDGEASYLYEKTMRERNRDINNIRLKYNRPLFPERPR